MIFLNFFSSPPLKDVENPTILKMVFTLTCWFVIIFKPETLSEELCTKWGPPEVNAKPNQQPSQHFAPPAQPPLLLLQQPLQRTPSEKNSIF
jgi:hypothetical protein